MIISEFKCLETLNIKKKKGGKIEKVNTTKKNSNS